MKKLVIAATLLAAVFSVNALAENESAEDLCKRYAKEDNVAPEQIESYVEQCVRDITGPEAEPAAEQAEGGKSSY